MKKRKGTIAVVAFSMAVLGMSCARTAPPRVLPGLSAGDPGWVAKTLKKMTLEEKAGQMVTVRFPGTFGNLDSDSLGELESLVRNRKIGGLILAAGEVYETADLLNAFRTRPRCRSSSPPISSAAGTKITGATLFPPLMSLGAAGSEDLAYEMGRITALEGRAIGIHMTYAPSSTSTSTPTTRSSTPAPFGEDPGRSAGSAAGLHPRLPGERHDRHGQAFSRARRHGPGLPPPPADDHGATGSGWRRSSSSRSGRPSRPASGPS